MLIEDISSLLNESSEGIESEEQSNIKVPEKKIEEIKSENIKSGRVKASPLAKKMALKMNIDITLVEGTGPQGRITTEDVQKYIENSRNKPEVSQVASKALENNYAEERVPMSSMRKVISARMLESCVISPTVTFNIKVDTSSLKKIRNALKDVCKVTYTDLLVKIVSKVLLQYPLLNCSVDGNELILRNFVNMGIAVALDDGLMVPVIKYANEKGLEEISRSIKELAQKAKDKTISVDELKGGTFTITNMGMYGIESFSPIINQPQVCYTRSK